MGTTERERSPNDDAQSSSRSSGDDDYEEKKEEEKVGCFVIEIIKRNGKEEIGCGDVLAADSNQVNGNGNEIEIEENRTDTQSGSSRSVIVEIKNEPIDDDNTVEMRSSSSSYSNDKTICRICHLGVHDNQSLEDSELIQLGCGCKDELGFSHMQCAETWFKQKGNIRCEICGIIAKNMRVDLINHFEEEGDMRRLYLVELNHMSFMETAAAANMNFSSSGRENSHKCHRVICNILMASIILIFFLPWFLHIDIL